MNVSFFFLVFSDFIISIFHLWPEITAGKSEAPSLTRKKLRVYMIKRTTGEHRNDFKTLESTGECFSSVGVGERIFVSI